MFDCFRGRRVYEPAPKKSISRLARSWVRLQAPEREAREQREAAPADWMCVRRRSASRRGAHLPRLQSKQYRSQARRPRPDWRDFDSAHSENRSSNSESQDGGRTVDQAAWRRLRFFPGAGYFVSLAATRPRVRSCGACDYCGNRQAEATGWVCSTATGCAGV